MLKPSLKSLARENGIELRRPGADGKTEPVSNGSLRNLLEALKVPIDERSLASTSARCFLPQFLKKRPAWGISLQLYELRSTRNWGIGDFADLWKFCDIAGTLGADFVGLSPLHAPFMANPERCSPYEPSNRRYLNPMYIAVDAVEGFETNPPLERQLEKQRDTALVDYKAVAQVKLQALRRIWQNGNASSDPLFAAFAAGGGDGLHCHALFEAISQTMTGLGQGSGWKTWPIEYQARSSPQIRVLEDVRSDEIHFHKWLQWLAHTQLTEAKERAERAGMRVGLYLDLAVGEALDGSATWSEPEIYVSGASVGNPPEPFATAGQDWRLAALLPTTIAAGEASPFDKLLTSAMRFAGAIRIDHAAALSRLFLVPADGVPADGAYVAYPTDDLLQVLVNASLEHQCLVIGEDLGNIPDGLREELSEANVLSYRILSYERNEAGFIAANEYPSLSLACVSTHDHQTFQGWWAGKDISVRAKHGLVPPDATEAHFKEREAERDELVRAFQDAGALKAGTDVRENAELDLAFSAYHFVGMTPSLLVAVRLADLTDEKNPTNVPGTDTSYPNWKPKLSVTIEDLFNGPFLQKVVATMTQQRPR